MQTRTHGPTDAGSALETPPQCVQEKSVVRGNRVQAKQCVLFVCFVFVGFGGPGDGFGGFPVGSKSSGKATTATTKKKATKTTRTTKPQQNQNEKQNEKHRLGPPLLKTYSKNYVLKKSK